MKFSTPFNIKDKNWIFYNSSQLITEQFKDETNGRKISELIESFFKGEKVAEIEELSLSNKLSFNLMVIWRSVQIQLSVKVDKFGLATFEFFVPEIKGSECFHFNNEDIPTIDKLLNIVNIKKSSSMANYLINFKRDLKRNTIWSTFTLTLINEHDNSKSTGDQMINITFKKLCHLIFSNSLTRISNWMHMFYYTTKYPNLSIEKMLSRSAFMFKTKLKGDKSKNSKEGKNNNKNQTYSINYLSFTIKNTKTSKTCLGRGGFGTVRSSMVYNKKAAMKIFDRRKDKMQNKSKTYFNDSMKEITATRLLNAPWIPKFYGFSFNEKNPQEEILFSGYAKGEKLSKWYLDILEEWPHLIYQVILELVGAISYIHHRGIFHGDLSLNNIIVDYWPRKEKVKISLIDFGLSGFVEKDEIIGLTVDFAAYEILLRDINSKFIRKIDIFAIGWIMFNIFYRTTFVSSLMCNCEENIKKTNVSNLIRPKANLKILNSLNWINFLIFYVIVC